MENTDLCSMCLFCKRDVAISSGYIDDDVEIFLQNTKDI